MFWPPPPHLWSMSGIMWSPGQRGCDVIVTHHRLSWQCHALEDYAMLWSKSRWAGLGLSLGAHYTEMGILKLAAWDPRLMHWGSCSGQPGSLPPDWRLSEQHRPSLRWCWCFSKLCLCYKQSESHIPMIYLLFVPIILEFKRCRRRDKRGPNDPFVWATTNACIPPGQLGE